jgi:hypothetical protein
MPYCIFALIFAAMPASVLALLRMGRSLLGAARASTVHCWAAPDLFVVHLLALLKVRLTWAVPLLVVNTAAVLQAQPYVYKVGVNTGYLGGLFG